MAALPVLRVWTKTERLFIAQQAGGVIGCVWRRRRAVCGSLALAPMQTNKRRERNRR